MQIRDYITASEKQYHLRLRTVVPVTDEVMDRIENAVEKYAPIRIARPRKTIFQTRPSDFMNVDGAEVWIVDMSFSLPASPNIVREDLRKALNCAEQFCIVRNMFDAQEIEHQRMRAAAEIEKEAKAKGLRPVSILDTAADYPEVTAPDPSKLFGNDYNRNLIAYLVDVEKERTAARRDRDSSLFNFIGIPDAEEQQPVQDKSDYNAHIPGAPSSHPDVSAEESESFPNFKLLGSVDDADREIKRVFTDKAGRRVVLSRKIGDL